MTSMKSESAFTCDIPCTVWDLGFRTVAFFDVYGVK